MHDNKIKRRLMLGIVCSLFYIVVASLSFAYFSKIIQIVIFCLIPLILGLFALGIFLKKEKIFKFTLLGVIAGILVIGISAIIVKTGIFENIDSAEELVELIKGFGIAGKAVFVLIQFLQVTFIPIPSTIVTAAGAMLYPAWEAILLCCIGLWIGSLVAFILGRTFGVKLVKWCIGEEMLIKYNNFVKGKDKAMFIYMFIFPVFPDDMLCLIAGLTTMSYPVFILVQLISRPLNVAGTVLLVDNIMAIPFSGWGIAVWILIAAVFVAVFILMWKYADKIEGFMIKFLSKITGKPIITDINAIYKIKTPPTAAIVKTEKTPDEIYQETNIKLTNIVNSKKAKQIEQLRQANETSEKILEKEDKPISF